MSPRHPVRGWVAAWAIGGAFLLVARALWRIVPIAVEPLRPGAMTPAQAALYLTWLVVNVYVEGIRGFHRRFSPRVVARALYLARRPSPPLWHVLLAPFFATGLIHASRRRKITSWTLIFVIVGLVLAVRTLEQPWRGIVDGGVVAGLAVGLASLLLHTARAVAGREPPGPLDLPESAEP